MKRYFWFIISFVLVFNLSRYAVAQPKKPVAELPKTTSFKLFFEKAYLHTDRDFYASGDDIWYKAYLVNGESNYPTYTSNNLYVELVSPDSKILTRQIIRMDQGMGVGDLKLTDSIPGGTYHLKAYTNWMRNFGDNFIFDKKITINSVAGIKPQAPVGAKIKRKKNALEAEPVPNSYKISFFPEGGSMVEGVMGVVGFKAEDALGNGIKVSGSGTSSSGQTVSQFESTDVGLGSFTLLPTAGAAYQVKGTYKNGETFNVDLPEALTEGYAIHIRNTDSAFVQVTVSASQAMFDKHKGQKLTLAAKHGDLLYFEGKFTLNDIQAAVNIPKAQLPAGIVSVLLYDEQLHPNCERLAFINTRNEVKVTLKSDKPVYQSKEKTDYTIRVTDAKGQPVHANLSLAAVDASIVPADETNISAYLLLQADIKGKIENAAQYFDPANANRFKQIDLLLLTQGWRDFVWKRLADSSNLKISYYPEAGFTVSGRLRGIFFDKPVPNTNITLFAPGAKGNKMFFTKTDQNGKYYLDNVELYGSQTLKLSARDDKGKKAGWLLLDTIGHDPLPVIPTPLIDEEPSAQLALFNAASKSRMNLAKSSRLVNGSIQLNQVEIKDVHRSFTSYTGEVLQTFGYPEFSYEIGSKYLKYKDLEDFLVHEVPGARTNPDAEGVVFFLEGKKVFPRLTVDKREDIFERIDYYTLTMDQVISVRVDHYVSMSSGDVMMIYLTLKPSAFDKKEFYLVHTDVTGYYSARTFYSPNYEYTSTKADQRTTIYWEPMISTDVNGQATVSYYNADPKSKIRIAVQGLTDKGVPITATGGYTIQ
jgi:hypothetical protein